MSHHYSDPEREDDPYSLPDIEVFFRSASEAASILVDNEGRDGSGGLADEWLLAIEDYPDTSSLEFWGRLVVLCGNLEGWYYWTCFPGCLPEGDPIGPFETEEEALEAARED